MTAPRKIRSIVRRYQKGARGRRLAAETLKLAFRLRLPLRAVADKIARLSNVATRL